MSKRKSKSAKMIGGLPFNPNSGPVANFRTDSSKGKMTRKQRLEWKKYLEYRKSKKKRNKSSE